MAASVHQARSVWEDRFNAPTAEELMRQIAKQWRSVAGFARTSLLDDSDVSEQVVWQGVWRWTLTYRHAGASEKAWAYLVPDPAKPRVCIPMSDSAIDLLPIRKTPKFIREALAFAPLIDSTRWPVWELQTRQQVQSLMALVTCKLEAACVAVAVK